MAADLRRAKKTFNIVSIALIDQLLGMFKEEPTLKYFKSEIQRYLTHPTDSHVPAANYFDTMNVETKVPPPEGETDALVVAELILKKDERLFGPECGVVVPALEVLNLKAKWPLLRPSEKLLVWGYLERLATHATQVVIGMQMLIPEMREALQKISQQMKDDPEEFARRTKSVLHAAAAAKKGSN